MYIDYAETPRTTDQAALKQFLDDLRDGQMDTYQAWGSKFDVVSESDITCDGYSGRFMVVSINDVAIYRAKTIVIKNRVYSIMVLMPKDDPKANDPKAYERLSLKFIESFKLIKDAVRQHMSNVSD